jgi:hypothetical protein
LQIKVTDYGSYTHSINAVNYNSYKDNNNKVSRVRTLDNEWTSPKVIADLIDVAGASGVNKQRLLRKRIHPDVSYLIPGVQVAWAELWLAGWPKKEQSTSF